MSTWKVDPTVNPEDWASPNPENIRGSFITPMAD
jgi:hypothetical protein